MAIKKLSSVGGLFSAMVEWRQTHPTGRIIAADVPRTESLDGVSWLGVSMSSNDGENPQNCRISQRDYDHTAGIRFSNCYTGTLIEMAKFETLPPCPSCGDSGQIPLFTDMADLSRMRGAPGQLHR